MSLFKSSPSKEVLVLTVGMDARKQAVFRMAFKMYQKTRYQLLEANDKRSPNIAIVDVDSNDGESIWNNFREEYPDVPAIIVTLNPDPEAPAPTLQKPVRMETLFPQLQALREGRLKKPAKAKYAAEAKKLIEEEQKRKAAEKKAEQEAAVAKPRPVIKFDPAEVKYFDPNNGLLGQLHRVRRDRIPAAVLSDSGSVLLIADSAKDEIHVMVSDDELQSICRQDNPSLKVRSPQPSDGDAKTAQETLTFESMLWKAGAWSCQGRLIKPIQANMPIRLKYWPNITRLMPVDNALRMAAFLTRSPVSPALTVRMLQVQPEKLFVFLAASHSIGLIELPGAQKGDVEAAASGGSEGAKSAEAQQAPARPQVKQSGGLLKKLFRRFMGG